MKKYKLIKEYPGSPKLGTEINYSKTHQIYNYNGGNFYTELPKHQVENLPEFWEEVVEKIYEISLVEDEIRVYYQSFDILENISHCKKVLLTTEDGVDIFEGDKFTTVLIDKLILMDINETANSKILIIHPDYKYFSTKEAAEEYILMNKPCLSINDLLKTRGFISDWFINDLKEVIKSKL